MIFFSICLITNYQFKYKANSFYLFTLRLFNNCWAFLTKTLVDINFVFDDFPKLVMSFNVEVKI